MDYWDFCRLGFEGTAMVPTYDDAYEAAEDYLNCAMKDAGTPMYSGYGICRYKRTPGEEDSYIVMMLPVEISLYNKCVG